MRRKRRTVSRFALAAIAGAFSAGLLHDVQDFRNARKFVGFFDENLGMLSSEEKSLVKQRGTLRDGLEKKLAPKIGKSPFPEFAFVVGTSPNALFDKKAAEAFGRWQEWEKKFSAEAQKHYPNEAQRLELLDTNIRVKLAKPIQMSEHALAFYSSAKKWGKLNQRKLRERAIGYGLGAAAAMLGYGGVRLIKSGRKGLQAPPRRHRGPR